MSAHRSAGILPVGQTRVSPDYEFFSAGKMPTGPTAKMAVLLIQPALRILLVVERNSLLSELECMLRVEHHRQLFCSRSVLARHDRAGMRPMRDPARMEGDRTAFNPPARSEISPDIKQDFIGFDVVVHPRDFHGLGMCIQKPGGEGTDNVTTNLKCLMNRWRLMDGAGDRFEILGVEGKGLQITVTADGTEGMVCQGYAGKARAIFDQNFDIFFLVDGDHL